MEIVMQWLDELDDLINAFRFRRAAIGRGLLAITAWLGALACVAGGIMLAVQQPAFAPVFASGLLVTTVYGRSQVTARAAVDRD